MHIILLVISLFVLNSCELWDPIIKGCTTSTACNYNSEAKEDDTSCIDPQGCNNWCLGDTTEVHELDCAGVCGGGLFLDCRGQCGILEVDECGVCGGNNTPQTGICDCNSTPNGQAFIDGCGVCVGGETGLEKCDNDCAGTWGGGLEIDECEVCNGDNTTCLDCNGELNGNAVNDPHYGEDSCMIECIGGNTNNTACVQDCEGKWGGVLEDDTCGVCGGKSTHISQCLTESECLNDQSLGCDNECHDIGSQPIDDECGICGGDDSTCKDCNEEINGDAYLDNCNICDADPENDCILDCSGMWGGTATYDECNVCGGNHSICSDCADVPNGDAVEDVCGVCDGDGTSCRGCTINEACNFSEEATIFDNSCWYPNEGCECSDGKDAKVDECFVCGGDNAPQTGICDCQSTPSGEAFIDGCGICVGGSTGLSACPTDCLGISGGTADWDECGICNGNGIEEGACDCDGHIEDCAGECGGSSARDECGICKGDGPTNECWNGSFTCDLADCSDCPVGTIFISDSLIYQNVCVPLNFSTVNQSILQAFYYFLSVEINDLTVGSDDWVGAFNGAICVGARKWDISQCGGGICDLPLMGDDGHDFTEDYMHTGEIPTFKIYDASENQYYDAIPSDDINPWGDLVNQVISNLFIAKDCNGELGGSAVEDCFSVCGGTAVEDCSGVCGGDTAEYDCWIDNPGAYEHTAAMNSIVLDLNGEQMGNVGDLLAGFDANGYIRALAIQLNVPDNFPSDYAGTILFEMQIRSNILGDLIHFKYYDVSEDVIYEIQETYTFVIDDIIGNAETPHQLHLILP